MKVYLIEYLTGTTWDDQSVIVPHVFDTRAEARRYLSDTWEIGPDDPTEPLFKIIETTVNFGFEDVIKELRKAIQREDPE